jgi:hypothetical protein
MTLEQLVEVCQMVILLASVKSGVIGVSKSMGLFFLKFIVQGNLVVTEYVSYHRLVLSHYCSCVGKLPESSLSASFFLSVTHCNQINLVRHVAKAKAV